MSDNSRFQALLGSWRSGCAKFDITSRASIIQFIGTLEHIAQALAQDEEARDLARAQLTFLDVEDEDTDQSSNKDEDLRMVCGSLAKFTRNLVAGVPENQVRA
ncbi:hypothetical protein C0993_009938 [Termitomyces sp. T159_Od127]|nr:hypothetical protein C0993_009938 [Termitomyces sp. T159_Od127]